MDDIRDLIQSKLSAIKNLEVGVPIPDDIVEKGKTYFGYEIQEDFIESDMDKNYTMQLSIIGRIVRKNNPKENTLKIVDIALLNIKTKLKELNIKYNYKDITMDDNIRKILVTGNAKYNEINRR